MLETDADQKYVACNADEGDSGTFADRMLMEGDPFVLIEGMTIAGLAVGATQGLIYLRVEYPHAHRALNEAIAAAYARGYLGANVLGSGRRFDLEVRLGAGAYICGEETSMLESLEGKRGEVRPRPPLPAVKGLFRPSDDRQQRRLARERACDPGQGRRVLSRLWRRQVPRDAGRSSSAATSVAAASSKRHSASRCASCCTTTAAEAPVDGRSGPCRSADRWAPTCRSLSSISPLDYEAFAEAGALVGHGGVVVFDDTVDMAQMARFALEFCAVESCGKCTPCRIGSSRGVEVIDRIRAGVSRDANLQLLEELCDTMVHGSLCGLGGMAPYPVQSALKYFRQDFLKAQPAH